MLFLEAGFLLRGLVSVSGALQDYGQHGAAAHDEGVVEVGYYLHGGYRGESCGHEQLCAVWDYALHETRECIEQACDAAGRDAEAVCYVTRDGAYGDYGDGVVCGADVGEDGEGGDGGLGAAAGAYAGGEARDDVVDAAAEAYHLEHAAGHHGYDYEFAHRGHSRAHGDAPVDGAHGSGGDAYDACRDYAECEYDQHVDAHDGGDYHQKIWYDGDERDLRGAVIYESVALREDIYCERYKCGGGYDPDIRTELVPHGASLRACSGYGGVGDER